jgi:hypothetical protein
MVRDAFANYVVQTTLEVVTDPAEKHKLMEELSMHSTELVGPIPVIILVYSWARIRLLTSTFHSLFRKTTLSQNIL